MDMSSHHGSLGDSAFVFDHQSAYPFDLTNGGSQTPKRDQLDLSPFQQDNDTTTGSLDLSHLRQQHEAEEANYLSCSNSPSPSTQAGQSNSSLGSSAVDFLHNNSLGLLGSLNPPSPPSQAFSSMQHHHAMMRPPMLQRQQSMSNLSDTSGSSYYNDNASVGSQSQLDPTSPARSSFTPSQSPMGITHSLSSISGLAIGTPQHQTFDLGRDNGQPRNSPFQGRNHDQLLSLSGAVQIMAPPPGKRRATGVAHTLYTSQLRQLRDEDGVDDSTPMPPQMQAFDGQHSRDVSNMMLQQSMMPNTPGRHSIGGVPAPFTTPHSGMATPDDSIRSSISSGFSAHRLRRMDSSDSTYSSAMSSPISEFGPSGHATGYPFQGRSLEEAMAEQEAKYAQYSQAGPSPTVESQSNSSHGGLSSSAMSRVSSAPPPSLVSGSVASDGSSQYAVPGTPSRTSTFLHQVQHSQHHYRKPSLPMTPHTPSSHQYHPQHQYDLTLSAPQMLSSRSMSNMHASMAVVSPMSLMDQGTPDSSMDAADAQDMNRSPSSGVSRTLSPRSRAQGNAPPPLIVSSADKLHVCFCGKRFKRLEHLKRHNRVHTQERPHPCPAPGCNKWFGRTDNLTQHLKTHYRTVGRSSEDLLNITNAKAASSIGQDGSVRHAEARHDPHAAAAAAAAQAVSKTNLKARRSTISNDVLGGPISLSRPSSMSPNADKGGQEFTRSPVMSVSLKAATSPMSTSNWS